MVCVNRLFLLCGICIAIHVVIEVVSVSLFFTSRCHSYRGGVNLFFILHFYMYRGFRNDLYYNRYRGGVNLFSSSTFCIATGIEALGMICITIDIEVASIFFLLLHFALLQV